MTSEAAEDDAYSSKMIQKCIVVIVNGLVELHQKESRMTAFKNHIGILVVNPLEFFFFLCG